MVMQPASLSEGPESMNAVEIGSEFYHVPMVPSAPLKAAGV